MMLTFTRSLSTAALSTAALCLLTANAPADEQAVPTGGRVPTLMWQRLIEEGKLLPVVVDVTPLMTKGIEPIAEAKTTPQSVSVDVTPLMTKSVELTAGAETAPRDLSIHVTLPAMKGVSVPKAVSVGAFGRVPIELSGIELSSAAKLPVVTGIEIDKLSAGTMEPMQVAVPPAVKPPGLVTGNGPEAKLLLADAYAEAGDDRAVALYEEVLAMFQSASKVSQAWEALQPKPDQGLDRVQVYEVLERLSAYHQKKGDNIKAAETLLRAEDFAMPTWLQANFLIEASRQYRAAGDEKKAQALYGKVTAHGYGWATGLTLIDQGRALMAQGRHEEARKLLATPVTGQYAEQIEPVKLMLLGYSYYLSGDLSQARHFTQQAITQYHTLTNPLPDEGMEAIIASAQERLQLIEGWINEPIQVEPREIVLVAQLNATEPLIRRFKVRTFRDMPLTVASDNAAVQVRVLAGDEWSESGAKSASGESEVVMEIAPGALVPGMRAAVTVTSPALAGAETKIALSVSAKLPGG